MAIKPNYYETLYVVRPDISEEELAKIQQKLNEAIAAHEGEIIKSDKWAQRELAYEIKDHTRGIYYISIVKALPGVVAALEKHLRFYNNDVLRFMTVSITEAAANREKASQEKKKEEKPSEPEVSEEKPSEPEVSEEKTSEPEVSKEETSEPEVPEEKTSEPEVSKEETSEPEVSKEETSEPEVSKEGAN